MSEVKRRAWPTEVKMPLLVDERLSIAQIRQAIDVARHDGPPMTLDEGLDWLEMNVHQKPRPPSPSTPQGARGARMHRRYKTPAGRPGRLRPIEDRAAA